MEGERSHRALALWLSRRLWGSRPTPQARRGFAPLDPLRARLRLWRRLRRPACFGLEGALGIRRSLSPARPVPGGRFGAKHRDVLAPIVKMFERSPSVSVGEIRWSGERASGRASKSVKVVAAPLRRNSIVCGRASTVTFCGVEMMFVARTSGVDVPCGHRCGGCGVQDRSGWFGERGALGCEPACSAACTDAADEVRGQRVVGCDGPKTLVRTNHGPYDAG